LLDDLRQRLANNEFGEEFPSELDLVHDYGVSRNTVRDAVRRLRAEGAVIAGRGRRPRPGRGAEIEQPLGALYSLFSSVEAAGLEQRSVVRTLEIIAQPEVASRLGLGASNELLHLERLRLAGGEPLALDHVWFPAEIARPLLDSDFTHTAFYEELALRTGVRLTGGEERIYAVIPDRNERSVLAITKETAALAIDRIGFVKDRQVEWRQTLVRGDRFNVSATFSAGDGYRLDIARTDFELGRGVLSMS
jgi:GntR family transcriptional regulator